MTGINLLDAIRIALTLGCNVKQINGTGEYRISHLSLPMTVRINGRRKDAPRSLTSYLKKLQRLRKPALADSEIRTPPPKPSTKPHQKKTPDRNDIAERLETLLVMNSDPGKFARLPLCVQSAVCDLALGLTTMCQAHQSRERGELFVELQGFTHHREILSSGSPPPGYRSWHDYRFFTSQQRMWQSWIFRASRTLRSTGCIAIGTDDLAIRISEQIACEMIGARLNGPLYTASGGSLGRRPSIEASVTYGLVRRGAVALDGKDIVTGAAISKAADDAAGARQANRELDWVQPVLVLPAGSDVRSDRLLSIALHKHVIIATTALPVRPLSLAG